MGKVEADLKYAEIKENISQKKYKVEVVMTKTLYPEMFIFDRAMGTRWNEEKVKMENKKLKESFREPKSPFEKGSEYYNDLLEYVNLYGFNEEQSEVLVGSTFVSRIKMFGCKLEYVKSLATLYSGILENPATVNTTITRTFVTKDELQENYYDGKYNINSYQIQDLFNENYIVDRDESINWNHEQVAITNIMLENNNKEMQSKASKVWDLLARDQVSYLCSLGLTLDQVASIYSEISNFDLTFYHFGYDITISELLDLPVANAHNTDTAAMCKLNYYADLLINLRDKA